jgi:hypothetical protein
MPVVNPRLFIGEAIAGATNGAPLSQSSTGTLASGIATSSVSSQSTTTTTSATPALLNSMTLTPVSGTYDVYFDTTVQTTTGGNSITFAIYAGGSIVTASSRTIQFPTATLIDSGYPFFCACQAISVTVNGSQAITVEWSTSGGTATCLNRTLSIWRTA